MPSGTFSLVLASVLLSSTLCAQPAPEPGPTNDAAPHTGAGRLVAGGIGLGASAGLAVTGGVMWHLSAPQDRADSAGTPWILAGMGAAASTTFLVSGVLARRKLHRWADARGRQPHRSGYGMFVGGVMLTSAGGFVTAIGVLSYPMLMLAYTEGPVDYTASNALIFSGLGTLAVGVPLLAFGKRRVDAFDRWRVQLAPLPVAGRRGFGLGISGRF